MTNRQYLDSLSNYEYAKSAIVHIITKELLCYMTSDDTIFTFTSETEPLAYKDALEYEIAWLSKEKVVE